MNILIVCADYAPIGGSHSLRMERLVNGLRSGEHHVIVATTGDEHLHPQYDPAHFKVPNDVDIVRIPMGKIHVKQYTQDKSDNVPVYSSSSIISRIKSTLLSAIKKNSIPDSLFDWYLSYKHNKTTIIKEIQKYTIDLIISCSMPNTTHLISYDIAKTLSIPLSLDIADPWAFIDGYNKQPIKHFIQKQLEKKILTNSIFATFSTEGARQLYIDKYNYSPLDALTLVSGYSSEQLLVCNKIKCNISDISHNHISLIYGGAILPGIRNPYPLIEAMIKYDTEYAVDSSIIEIKLYVDRPREVSSFIKEKCQSTEIQSYCKVSGYIPFDSLMNEMMRSDILVLFGNSTTTQLPGKIFEYIATGKHILYIINCDHEKDQVLPILSEYKNFTCVENNTMAIFDAIRYFGENPEIVREKMADNIENYLSDNIFKKLNDFLLTKSIG